MALDGMLLHHLAHELKETLIQHGAPTSRVSQIHQPSRDELVLSLRTAAGVRKLLLSAKPSAPRVCFIQTAPENPAAPPMFCMLLRKRLGGARVADIRQPDLERVLFLDLEAIDELGDKVKLTLAVEIMGKYSNVIFLETLPDGSYTIIDALRRVDPTMTTQRLVLPGMKYELPPAQDKLSVLTVSADEIVRRVLSQPERRLDKAILAAVQGVSPIVCREIAHLTTHGGDIPTDELTAAHIDTLTHCIGVLADTASPQHAPCLVCDPQGKPRDISFINITQYGSAMTVTLKESYSALLEDFYRERDEADRRQAKQHDLLRILTTAYERISRKINTQQAELDRCADREQLRIKGDLLHANVHRVQKGMPFVDVENFYDENMSILRIELDPAKTPAENAQKYYKDYRKAKTAQTLLTEQLRLAHEELQYIDMVFDELTRANTSQELGEIRAELVQTGYIRQKQSGKGKPKEKLLPPLEFTTTDGFKVLVGRNNRQNDRLTLKTAKKRDIWLHTKDIAGSHTILVTDGRQPTEQAILEAARLAALHSKAKDSAQVPVDYTEVKYVSKPKGAKPGMVIFTNNRTVYVTPSSS